MRFRWGNMSVPEDQTDLSEQLYKVRIANFMTLAPQELVPLSADQSELEDWY